MSIADFPDPVADGFLSTPHPVVWQVAAAGHQFTLFVESGPLVQSVLADLNAAQRRIWLESYIFAADPAGKALAAVLKAKAQAGLDVRVMYDAVGCLGTPNAFFEDMQRSGVKVHGFHKFGYAVRRWDFFNIFNRRNHRKLLVTDDDVAYFGGMNFVDRCGVIVVDESQPARPPVSSGWRDVHVRLSGPQVPQLAATMNYLWYKAQHIPAKRARWPRRKMLQANADGLFFFDCEPGFKGRQAARVLCPLLRRARRTIYISMAYFIPSGPVLRELLRAVRRGVKVRVLIPANSDVPMARWACRHHYERLVERGIRIYERQDLMLHSKALVIDGQWSVIGSCNLDPRSLRSNLEFLGVVRGRSLARTLEQICAYELRHSHRIVADHWRCRSWWQRQLDWLAWVCRRWL
jgi:cardiolipin synthase A/B